MQVVPTPQPYLAGLFSFGCIVFKPHEVCFTFARWVRTLPFPKSGNLKHRLGPPPRNGRLVPPPPFPLFPVGFSFSSVLLFFSDFLLVPPQPLALE